MNKTFDSSLPASQLQGMIRRYWSTSYENAIVKEIQLFPRGLYYLIFTFNTKGSVYRDGQFHKEESDAFVVGQPIDHRVSFFSQKDTKIIGVELTPVGLYKLFGIPVHLFNNTIEDLALLNPQSRILFEQLRQAKDFKTATELLNQYLTFQMIRKDQTLSPYVMDAYTKISAGFNQSIEQLSKEIFISKRQLQRNFIEQIGQSPKALMAMQKAHHAFRTLLQKKDQKLDTLSYKLGYTDSSHMSKSFKKFFGSSPQRMNLDKILSVEKFNGWKKFSSFSK